MSETGPPLQRPSLPRRKQLHYRLIISYGLLFVLILTLLMALVLNTVYSVQIGQAVNDLEVRALLTANALEDPLSGYSRELENYERHESEADEVSEDSSEAEQREGAGALPGTDALQHLADRHTGQGSLWLTIFDVRGDAIVDSRPAPSQMPNQLGAPEIQAVLRRQEKHDVRVDPVTGVEYLFAAAPVQIGDHLLGIVRMARPMSEVRAPILALARNLLLAGAAALLLATVLSFLVAGRLVRPIRKLEESALAVAAGDLSQTVDIQSDDEVGSLARAFDHMVGELQETMRRQRFFIANASHELRTPLTNIKLRSEALLALDGEDPELNRRYLREIDGEADRLARLATVMLDLARLDYGEPARPETPADLRPMLLAAAKSMQLRMEDAELDLRVDVKDPLPPVAVHVDEIEIVVLNLLDNAIKYTPAGGSITLGAEARTDENGPSVSITVIDSGPGIPPEDIDHVFEYFYRVDKARSRQDARSGSGSGSGLGLAIVQKLVDQNGGQIRVSSVPGRGTTFSIRFPLPA